MLLRRVPISVRKYGLLLLAPALTCIPSRVVAQDTQPTKTGPADPAQVAIPSDTEGQPVGLSLDEALQWGRRNNLRLHAAALAPMSAAEDVRGAKAVFEPEIYSELGARKSKEPGRNVFQPSLTREIFDGQVGVRQRVVSGGLFDLSWTPLRVHQAVDVSGFPSQQYTSTVSLSYTQPLLRGAWTDYALRNERVAEAVHAGSVQTFSRQVQDTMLDIVRAYWELVFARENYRVVTASLALAREQLRITLERIRVRELAERDRIADEADVARRLEQQIVAENQIREREDGLRRLLFRDEDGLLWSRNLRPTLAPEVEPTTERLDWRELARVALRARPDLAALRTEVTIAEFDLAAAERDTLPQLDLVSGYNAGGVDTYFRQAFEDSFGLDFPDWSVRLQFSVPIGNQAALAARDRARIQLERRRRELYAAEIDVASEVRQALRNVETLAQSIGASLESRRLAETNLDTERVKQRVGLSTPFEVQRRNQELQEARSRLLRNQLDYRIAQAALEHAQGKLRSPEDPQPVQPK